MMASCAGVPEPAWRSRVVVMLDELVREDAQRLAPQEYHNLVETFEHGEAVLHVRQDVKAADTYYVLAYQKGVLLGTGLKQLKELQLEEERQRAAEQAARAEEERLLREAEKVAEQQRLKERQDAEAAEGRARAAAASREAAPAPVTVHTVRRGETLPQIAARTEIYNDSSLWPLIYRANRDQVRDPKQLWPGQVLKIPRHFTRDEALEAKRYSGRK